MPRRNWDDWTEEQSGDLHPPPRPALRIDHRDTHNRVQMREPSHLHGIWKRAVEQLAADLQIEPIEAHTLLRDAERVVERGQAHEWWL